MDMRPIFRSRMTHEALIAPSREAGRESGQTIAFVVLKQNLETRRFCSYRD
jgi:hypothetical protein